MVKAWTCHLLKSSPRYHTLRAILNSDEVPIKNPIEHEAQLGDSERALVHALDIKASSADQTDRLIDFIIEKLGADIAEINHRLDTEGFPIRAEDVSVAFDARYFM